MPTTVQTPDGGSAVFPDGMSDAQIEAVLQKEYPAGQAPAAAAPASSGGVTIDSVVPANLPPAAPNKTAQLPPSNQTLSGLVTGAPPTSTLEDVARSAWGGLTTGLAGSASMILPPPLASLALPVVESAFPGLNYQPKTTAGRYTHAVATMAPNAIAPESIPAKIAATVLPGLAQEGARDIAGAMGAGPKGRAVAAFAGGLAGGGLAGGMGAARVSAPQILSDAEKPVANALQSYLDMTGGNRDDIAAATAAGRLPLTATPGMTQLGNAVATQPGAGQVLIRDAVGGRLATTGERTLQAVNDHLGVDAAAAHGDVDSIVKQGQQAVKPLYDALRSNPAPVMTPRLALLAQTPAVKKAIGITVDDMLNDPDGPSPTAAGFKLDPATGNWSLPSSGSLEGITEQQPTAATWIGVHQNMGRAVDRSQLTNAPLPDTVSPGNRNISSVAGKLGDELRTAIPGYSEPLDQAGDYTSVRGAFNRASGKLFSGSVYDFNDLWGSLRNPSEVKAAQAALANDVLTKSESANFGPGAFRAPGVQQKLAIAFGPNAAENFSNQMDADAAEKGALGSITGNSATMGRAENVAHLAKVTAAPTKPSLAGMLQKGAGSLDTVMSFTHLPTAITRSMKFAADRAASKGGAPAIGPAVDPGVAASLGELLTNGQKMSAFLDRMAAQRVADAGAARASGGLLTSPRVALPGLLSGLGAPSAAQAGQGQPPP